MGREENERIEMLAGTLAGTILFGSGNFELDTIKDTDDVDYKILNRGRLTAVGEVKCDIEQDIQEFEKLRSQAKIQTRIELPHDFGSWQLRMNPKLKRSQISDQKYIDLVSMAMSEGIRTWQPGLTDPEPTPLFLAKTQALGVSLLFQVNPISSGHVRLEQDMRLSTNVANPQETLLWLNGVIAKHSEKRSYLRFAEYGAHESHVFIVVGLGTPQNIRFWASMTAPGDSDFRPELPPHVTHLFVGVHLEGRAGERSVWLYRPCIGWEFHNV